MTLSMQHYAVKTLENLCTRKDLWTDSLAHPNTAGKQGSNLSMLHAGPLLVAFQACLNGLGITNGNILCCRMHRQHVTGCM